MIIQAIDARIRSNNGFIKYKFLASLSSVVKLFVNIYYVPYHENYIYSMFPVEMAALYRRRFSSLTDMILAIALYPTPSDRSASCKQPKKKKIIVNIRSKDLRNRIYCSVIQADAF